MLNINEVNIKYYLYRTLSDLPTHLEDDVYMELSLNIYEIVVSTLKILEKKECLCRNSSLN